MEDRMKTRNLIAFAGAMFVGGIVMAAPPQLPDVVKEPTREPVMSRSNQPAGPLDFAVKDINGKDVDLKQYKGKVVMIVNVASKCGFTPQYTALEAVYEKYKDKGFVILGFPANNFGHQEPGTNEEILQFCSSKYMVKFPLLSKISVKDGADGAQAPIYKFLTTKDTAGDFGGEITWNFNKFLVDRNGNLIARFGSPTKPDDAKVTAEIEKALAAKGAGSTASAK
jgi:glutathione peroxidase